MGIHGHLPTHHCRGVQCYGVVRGGHAEITERPDGLPLWRRQSHLSGSQTSRYSEMRSTISPVWESPESMATSF